MCICFSYSFWSAHSVKNEQIQQLHLSDISNLINWLKVSPFMDSFFSMFLISSLTMYLISVRNRDRDCWTTFILSSISAKNNLLLFLRVLLIGSTTTVLVLMSFWAGTPFFALKFLRPPLLSLQADSQANNPMQEWKS